MSIQLRRPQFVGTDREKLSQMHSYIYQLVEQLEWAFENVETSGHTEGGTTIIRESNNQTIVRPPTPEEAQENFSAIKNLIIKSADIVDAYYDKIDKRLVSNYEALSDFGSYKQSVDTKINANAERITLNSEKVETLSELSKVYQDRGDSAVIVKSAGYIKTGFLEGNTFGIEIGQREERDDVETMKGSARFVPGEIVFYDINDLPSAWLSNRRLHAEEVEAVRKQQTGGFVDEVADNGDVTTRWVGRES